MDVSFAPRGEAGSQSIADPSRERIQGIGNGQTGLKDRQS
jgi:hypothetical protein